MSVSVPGCKPGLPKPAASLTACVRVFAFGVMHVYHRQQDREFSDCDGD